MVPTHVGSSVRVCAGGLGRTSSKCSMPGPSTPLFSQLEEAPEAAEVVCQAVNRQESGHAQQRNARRPRRIQQQGRHAACRCRPLVRQQQQRERNHLQEDEIRRVVNE